MAATPASSKRAGQGPRPPMSEGFAPSPPPPRGRRARRCRPRRCPGTAVRPRARKLGSRTAAVPMMTRRMPVARARPRPVFMVADAAAELHRQAHALQDGLDRGRVHRLAGKGTVEIDDMQPVEALRLEICRLGGRIIVEDGRLRHVALPEAHALAVLEVDCREQDHGRHRRKLARSARPSCWLFSGWNCVPTMLSRPTDRRDRSAIACRRRDHVLGFTRGGR